MSATDDDPFEGTGFAAAVRDTDEKGTFEFPTNATDLIGLFLDPDIRAARDKVHAQIEANAVRAGARTNAGGIAQNNTAVTPAAAAFQKAVVSIHALNEQAKRNRVNRR